MYSQQEEVMEENVYIINVLAAERHSPWAYCYQ